MGIDITLHAEVKILGNWHHYTRMWLRQDYRLFYKLVGEEASYDHYNDITPFSSPRGLPDGVTFTTSFEHEHETNDESITSWVGREEIAQLMQWLKEEKDPGSDMLGTSRQWKYLYGTDWTAFNGEDELPDGVEDWRFVFWFW